MWDVIEHLTDPEELLRAAVPFLKDTGLLIIETGNFQSAERILKGPKWWGYAADHRWYFSPLNAARLLHKAGYEHCVLAKKVLRPGWNGTAAYKAPSWPRRLKRLARNPLALLDAVEQWKLLKKAEREWMQWAGLGIFTIAASRHPLRICKEGIEPVSENRTQRDNAESDALLLPVHVEVK